MNHKKIDFFDKNALSIHALEKIVGGGGKNSKSHPTIVIKPIQGGWKTKPFYPQYQYFPVRGGNIVLPVESKFNRQK